MPHSIRVAQRRDIPAMHRVRLAVVENRLTSDAIREEHYVAEIERTGRGWVAEDDGRIVGFAIGRADSGNIWALFVDPAAERRGIGRDLHDTMVAWLFATGLGRLWLGTDPDTRARRFYERAGWRFVRRLPDGEAMYELLDARPADGK